MSRFDVFGVGNAIVDSIAFVEDPFLEKLKLELSEPLQRGAMSLADLSKQSLILEALQPHSVKMCSGGSAANTIWTLMLCGAKLCYSGKVANDSQGLFYMREFKDSQIEFPVAPLDSSEGPSGSCIVLTTPDAQRTMSTHLGVSVKLSPADIDLDLLHAASYVYCEGYLWTGESTRQACLKAMREAKKAGIPAAFSYSDPFLVKNYRDDFEKITQEYCDIIFCNLEEAQALAQTETRDVCLNYIKKQNVMAFITHGKEGCFVCHNNEVSAVPGFTGGGGTGAKVVDSNGAGDAFAGGTLFALSQGYSPLEAARWGSYLGSEIVSIPGARLGSGKEKNYAQKYKEILGAA